MFDSLSQRLNVKRKRIMKNELIIFAAAIALLAGCSKEEGSSGGRTSLHSPLDRRRGRHARDGCRIRRGRQLRPHRPQPHERDSTVARRRTLPEQWFVYANSGRRRNADSQIPREISRFLRLLSLPRGVYRGGSSFTFTVQSDQSAGRNYTNSDLMSAVRQNVALTADAVELTFSHWLTRLDIELMPGEGFAAADELKGSDSYGLKTSRAVVCST